MEVSVCRETDSLQNKDNVTTLRTQVLIGIINAFTSRRTQVLSGTINAFRVRLYHTLISELSKKTYCFKKDPKNSVNSKIDPDIFITRGTYLKKNRPETIDFSFIISTKKSVFFLSGLPIAEPEAGET